MSAQVTFTTEIAGRRFKIRDGYRGGGIGSADHRDPVSDVRDRTGVLRRWRGSGGSG